MARLNCDEEQARQYIAEGQQDPDLGDEKMTERWCRNAE